MVEVGVVAEGSVFFAAVEAPDGEHDRGGADVDGQTQVADDLLAFEGNAHNLDRRVRNLRVGGEGFERLIVGFHLARGVLQRKAREEVVLEGVLVVLRCLGGIGRGLPRLRHVAVADRAPRRGPFVAV